MSDDGTLPDRLRNMVRNPNAVGTHYDECWQWHDDCALLLAADRLAALTDAIGTDLDRVIADLTLAADPESHYCSERGNWAGGYDCACGMSGWYTHLSVPPHQGCGHKYALDRAIAVLAAAVQPPDPNQDNQQGECND